MEGVGALEPSQAMRRKLGRRETGSQALHKVREEMLVRALKERETELVTMQEKLVFVFSEL